MLSWRWHEQDPTILIATYEGDWTWAEHFELLHAIETQIQAAPVTRVDLIVDVSHSGQPPLGSALSNITRALRLGDTSKFGVLVFAGSQGFNRVLLGMITKVYRELREMIVFEADLPSAYARIYAQRDR
jgi:hypothetical protein